MASKNSTLPSSMASILNCLLVHSYFPLSRLFHLSTHKIKIFLWTMVFGYMEDIIIIMEVLMYTGRVSYKPGGSVPRGCGSI